MKLICYITCFYYFLGKKVLQSDVYSYAIVIFELVHPILVYPWEIKVYSNYIAETNNTGKNGSCQKWKEA